ncbi:MAG: hypothetical protein LC650_00540 [Actinobacteria bacterium]|nr:hypothetical protein [Actinomycetota bacterium]
MTLFWIAYALIGLYVLPKVSWVIIDDLAVCSRPEPDDLAMGFFMGVIFSAMWPVTVLPYLAWKTIVPYVEKYIEERYS